MGEWLRKVRSARGWMPFRAVLVVSLVLAVACGSDRDPSDGIRVEVEPIELPGERYDVRFTDDSVWVVLEGDDPAHVVFDMASGEVVSEIDELIGSGGPVEWDGYLWFLNCGYPHQGLPEIGINDYSESRSREQLVKVDPKTLESVGAVALSDECFGREPAIVDGVWWSVPHAVDLETGELISTLGRGETIQAEVFEGVYWASIRTGVYRAEGKELVRVLDHPVEFGRPLGYFDALRGYGPEHRPTSQESPVHAAVKYWDGRYWVSGESRGEPGRAFEFDPDTGEILGSVPAEEIPLITRTVDGYRFDLHSETGWDPNLHPVNYTSPWPDGFFGSGWRMFDLESGEPIGQFDFGSFRPLGGGNGSLWLVGPNDTVGRVPLEHLVELAAP